ncbi:lysosomal amino acid transporter 1 homolog isoform X2 [Gadus morhua]|uniref:Lysosomal amino acid transporter 1 homolog n=2 Tax=Gadus morhua TaxID=8049 RepID=A0A8C5CKK5_GADMO|nr:putative uncharacterized protein SLC66A1L isoform X2 [Gadus morhua]
MATTRFPGKGGDDVAMGANFSNPTLSGPFCVNGTGWILYLLEECVDNVWEYWSVIIGLISMFCFLLSTLPQVYEANRNGKVEEAMSFGFLFFLFSGDLTSFAGCYLTSQLPIQMVTVVFYMFTDMVLFSQYLYYKIKNSSTRENPHLKWACLLWCGSASLFFLVLPKLITDDNASLDTQSHDKSHTMEMSGYVCGYLASIFYLSSRFPQLHKNFRRHSTEGTSYLLFALAMMGNGTYGLSVIVVLPALKGSRRAFLLKHLPWLIGSLGVLVLDFFVTAQFIMYRKSNPAKKSTSLVRVQEVEPLLYEEEELSAL